MNKQNNKLNEKYTAKDIELLKADLRDFSSKSGIFVEIDKPIGMGGFSLIYQGTIEKRNFAIKLIPLINNKIDDDKSKLEKNNKWAHNEMIVSSNLKNNNCVRCYGCFNQTNSKIIILEYAINKDLSVLTSAFYQEKLFPYLNMSKIDNINGNLDWLFFMSESLIRFFFNQIVNALSYLKKMNFLHRDLKLENLLLLRNFQIKLSDFALSTAVPNYGNYKMSNAGTIVYMGPEYFDKNKQELPVSQAYKIDYYALGVILMKMLTNEYVIKFKNNDSEINKYDELKSRLLEITNDSHIIQNFNRSKEITSDGVVNLMKGLLEWDIQKRLDLDSILNSEWLKINEEQIRYLHEIHDNDYLKFLLEMQKLDYIKKDNLNIKTNIEQKENKIKQKTKVIESVEYFRITSKCDYKMKIQRSKCFMKSSRQFTRNHLFREKVW